MAVLHWLRHPKLLVARLRYWVWEKQNPDKPWLCPDTVRFCEKHLRPNMQALEFGSGRSTRWFSQHVGQLTSIEHHREWHAIVQQQLAAAGATNVDYRHVALDHPESEGERPTYEPTPAYVAVADSFPDASLDFVVVDGHYRTHCVHHVIPKLAPQGYLLVDDANFWPDLERLAIPKTWRIVDDSTNGIKRCVIWQAPPAADS